MFAFSLPTTDNSSPPFDVRRSTFDVRISQQRRAYLPMSNLARTVASLSCLAQHEELDLAILFGSCARDRAHRDSDLDIAVFPRYPLNPAALQSLSDELAIASGRPIDLIDLTHTNGTLLRQILLYGKVLFAKRPAILGNLNERLIDWQADFEPAQQAILTAQRNRFLAHAHGS